MNRETVRTLWSADRKSRVHVFRRPDGTFGFLQERYSEEEFEHCWIPVFGATESFFSTEEIAMCEVTSRVPWLAEMVASFEEIDGMPRPLPEPPPPKIGDSRVLCFCVLDRRHRHTGNCIHRRGDVVQGPAICLAVCQYLGDDGYYLFSCNEKWDVITDTYHVSIDEAKQQAEFEYSGTLGTWVDIASQSDEREPNSPD